MARLTNRKKNWLLYNLKKFHADDQYFKYLNNKIVLSSIKYKIHKSNSTEDLYEKLKNKQYTDSFHFYRKDGKVFTYPSIRDQVFSLLECWDELRNCYIELQSGNEHEYEQIDDEPFGDSHQSDNLKIKRKTFGNKLNVNSIPHLKEEASFLRHVMSSNKYIKSSFSFEYHFFKKRCLGELEKVEKRKQLKSYFFQTDLKSFFHQLRPDTILRIIKKYNLKNVEKWIDELVTKDGGLPIGWVLSGIISDLVMMELSSFVESIHDDLTGELGVSKIEMISYVDDLIFFIGSSHELKDPKDFVPKMVSVFQKRLDEFFKGSEIEIYGIDSRKVKFIPLDKALASVLRTNWHNIDIIVSGDEGEIDKKWNVLDEFLLPPDNDLILNEKSQFFNNLKNLKVQITRDEITTSEEFSPYLEKIFYKISLDKKYLASVFDVVFTFLQRNKPDDENAIIDNCWDKVMGLSDVSSIDFIQFIKRYLKYNTENNGSDSELLVLLKKAIREFDKNNNLKNTSDKELFLTYVRMNFPKLLKKLKVYDLEKEKKFYFNQSGYLFVKYSELIQERSTSSKTFLNPFICSEIIQSKFKNRVKNSTDLLFMVRNLSLLIKNQTTRKDFTSTLFDDFSYEIVPYLSEESIRELVDFFNENQIESELSLEIKNVLKNYNQLFDFFLESRWNEFHGFINSLNDIKKYKYKRPKKLNFEILKPDNGKMFVFYKEILTCTLFSVSSISDALKLVLFQYKPIESNVFVSWKALPTYFNALSNITLALTKEFYKQKISGLIGEKPDLTKNIITFQFRQHLDEKIKSQTEGRIRQVNLDSFDQLIAGDSRSFERFKKNDINLMISNIEIDINHDLNSGDNFRLTNLAKNRVHWQVMNSLREAVLRKCDVICFPELTLPLSRLGEYLDFAGRNKLIVVAGVEYIDLNSNKVINPSIISFPTERRSNPLSRSYHAFMQFKNYISIKEINEFSKIKRLDGERIDVVEGKEVIIFNDLNINNFSILSCSDFLSLELKYHMQGKVQTLFVPAMNYDNTTYYHVAQAAIRELYCICVICNNSFMGASMVCAPYREEYDRLIFKIEGKSRPKAHYLTIKPSVILELQHLARDRFLCFEKNTKVLKNSKDQVLAFKQPPPDWYSLMKDVVVIADEEDEAI